MNLQAKRKEATRLGSRDFTIFDGAASGRIAAKKVYHGYIKFVKCFLLAGLFALTVLVCLKAYRVKNPVLMEATHRVTYGESLWSIAEKYKPDGMSMSVYMDWIYSRNGSSMIYPGDVVVMGVVSE